MVRDAYNAEQATARRGVAAAVPDESRDRGRPAKNPVTRRLPTGRRSYAGRASTFYFHTEEDKQRATNTYRARGGIEGYESMSDLVSDLVMAWVEQQETTANGSKPFNVPRRRARGSST